MSMSKLSRTMVRWRFAAVIAYNMLKKYVSRAVVPRGKMNVTIEQGTVQGLHYTTQISNKPYVSFLGVPYAKPPINELRFKPPVKHPGWSGVLKTYSEGNMCMQYDALISKKVIGSEDCLYLNVFVPQEESSENKAVMVFIHGGAFNFGSASSDLYSPDYLIDENVIVVTINYRLNVLGFLNLEIDECPGNMGLKDQLLALKWVKANISAFGGDASNITIFGESAGSASVHCHTLSPQSTGSFQKAIMQSGCIFNSWACHRKHKEVALKFAKKIGCQEEDPEQIVEYLRNVPAIDLVKCTIPPKANVNKDEKDVLLYEFIPSIESDEVNDRFLSAPPEILIKNATPIPIISGVNNLEGMIAFAELKLNNTTDFNSTEIICKILETNLCEEDMNKVKNFYFNENDVKSEQTKLENICNLFSDVFFIKEFHRGFHHLLQRNVTPVYNYEFKFDGEINIFKKLLFSTKPAFQSLKGACHGDELNYIFYAQLFGFAPRTDSSEMRMCKTISKLWSNFAKTGNPNSSDLSFNWDSTSAENPKYLSLNGDDTHMVDGLVYSSRVNFWQTVLNTVGDENPSIEICS